MWSGASLRRWNCAEADHFWCTCRHGSWTQAWVQNIWAEGRQKLLWWTLTILLGRVRSLSYVNLQLEERERVIRDEEQTRNIREAERSRTIAVARDFSEQPFIEAQRCKQGRWGHCRIGGVWSTQKWFERYLLYMLSCSYFKMFYKYVFHYLKAWFHRQGLD